MASQNIVDDLNAFLESVYAEKRASEMGDKETTHPSKSVDDGTIKPSEGSRSAENSSDVKAGIGEGSVDSTPAEPGETPVAEEVGTATAVEEDPAVEDNYKSTKDDPGTSSPMTAADGEKYSSYNDLAKLANEIAGALAQITKQATQTEPAPQVTKEAAEPQTNSDESVTAVKQAGYNTAAAILGQLQQFSAEFEKTSAEKIKAQTSVLVKQAEQDAENLVGFLVGLSKKAEELPPEEAALAEAAAAEGGEGAPMEEPPVEEGLPGEGGEELSPEVIEAIAQALAEAGIDPETLAGLGGEEEDPTAGGDLAGLEGLV